jgi:hypothetical protein
MPRRRFAFREAPARVEASGYVFARDPVEETFLSTILGKRTCIRNTSFVSMNENS